MVPPPTASISVLQHSVHLPFAVHNGLLLCVMDVPDPQQEQLPPNTTFPTPETSGSPVRIMKETPHP